jgi:hypothetical protein
VSIHDRVREKIEAGVPCYAQATIGGHTISMHPDYTGFGMTFSGGLFGPHQDMPWVRAVMIDLWVRGKARVSPMTFSRKELEWRAGEHEHGNGPDIIKGDRNAAFAKQIRQAAEDNADKLAVEPCPH